MVGPFKLSSSQGICTPIKFPIETPRKGIIQMMTAPKNRPNKKSLFFIGVVNKIWLVFSVKSRAAAEFKNAVIINKESKDIME